MEKALQTMDGADDRVRRRLFDRLTLDDFLLDGALGHQSIDCDGFRLAASPSQSCRSN